MFLLTLRKFLQATRVDGRDNLRLGSISDLRKWMPTVFLFFRDSSFYFFVVLGRPPVRYPRGSLIGDIDLLAVQTVQTVFLFAAGSKSFHVDAPRVLYVMSLPRFTDHYFRSAVSNKI
jgi:hypothetical protein